MIYSFALGLMVLFSAYYFRFISRIRMSVNSLESGHTKKNTMRISVVVAARNEESNIAKCLDSLMDQSYPADRYEIIIVDDSSADGTVGVIEKFKSGSTNLHLIALTDKNKRSAANKTSALAVGIKQAAGEIILTTDADCIVPRNWISTMVSYFDEGVAFVAGPVRERSAGSFFSKMAELEFLGLMTTTAGLIGSGRPIICSGANLGYLKSAFNEVGGFGLENSSNDDEYLMSRFIALKAGKIVFAAEYDAVVITESPKTISTFLTQRVRWANKRRHYSDISVFITLVSLYFFFFFFFLNVILSFFNVHILFIVPFIFICKIFVDYSALLAGARIFRMKVAFFHFLIAEILHVPYIAIAAPVGQFSSIIWKGRRI